VITLTSPPEPAVVATATPWRAAVAACLAVAVVSLLLPSVPTYDPWAWLLWGRQIASGELATTGGPSWKPLPVLFTTPFSLLGDTAAPLAWLAIARAGGLLAVTLTYRLGTRLAGPVAGVVAAGALVLCDGFVFTVARGNSEGLLVALCLWAVERHLDGRRTAAFLLGVGAGLLRPEVWPLLAVYGVLLIRREPGRRTVAIVGVSAMATALAWFVPELVGSGNLLRAATRARQPNADAATFDAHPFLAVFERSAPLLTWPVYVGAMAAVVVAWRRRDRLVLVIAAVASALMVTVALMTKAGFAGNLRYVVLPAALVCVLAGIGWVELARGAARRGGDPASWLVAVGALLLAVFPVASDLRALHGDAQAIAEEAALDGSLGEAIERAGGRETLLACGRIYTGAFQTPVVAWHLDLPQADVELDLTPTPPGTVIAPRSTALARSPWFAPLTRSEHWSIASSCR
jgi:hypothetical protein